MFITNGVMWFFSSKLEEMLSDTVSNLRFVCSVLHLLLKHRRIRDKKITWSEAEHGSDRHEQEHLQRHGHTT